MRTITPLCVLVFFLLCACSSKTPLAQPRADTTARTDATAQPADCSTFEQDSMDAASCYARDAREKKDYSICERISGVTSEALRSACFKDVAAALQDESVCDQMTLPNSEGYQVEIERGICKEFVKSQSGIVKAPARHTPSQSGVTLEQCQAMTDQEQMTTAQCYFKVAVFGKDYPICNNIIGEINQQTRIMCYNEVAKALKDATVCDRMDVPSSANLDIAKQQCKQYVG
jgi:hypothetical protein